MNRRYSIVFRFALVFSLNAIATSFSFGQAGVSPEQAIARLKEGNKRFVSGKSAKPRQDFSRMKEVAEGQFPFAYCSWLL